MDSRDSELRNWSGKSTQPGHVTSPTYITLKDDTDPAQGLGFNDDPPRFSTGQMILENRPGMLVELHMLKDYKTRVTGNYELLRALLEVMNRDAAKLIALNREADAQAEKLGSHPLDNEISLEARVEWRNHPVSLSRLQIHPRAKRSFGNHDGLLFPRSVECDAALRYRSQDCPGNHAARRLHHSAKHGLTSSMYWPHMT